MKRRTTKERVKDGYVLALMLVLAGIVYMSFTHPIRTERPAEQQALYANVPAAKPGPPPTATPVAVGDALTYLRIPRFGDNWMWAVLEGTSEEVLANGPGHYPGTPLPGGEGNTAYAAHRAGHGDPFIDFDLLRPGDEVEFEQRGARWTYTITTQPTVIEPDEDWVLDPLPGRQMTLTTCYPKYGSAKRMFVQGKLTSVETFK